MPPQAKEKLQHEGNDKNEGDVMLLLGSVIVIFFGAINWWRRRATRLPSKNSSRIGRSSFGDF
jgi:hypothetical protein